MGVTEVFGVDSPKELETENVKFKTEHTMTPSHLTDELSGFDKAFFKCVFAGNTTKKIYRLFEFEKD